MSDIAHLFIRHTDISSKGEILEVHPWKPSNTVLKQFLQILMVQFIQNPQTVLDITNTGQSVGISSANFNLLSPSNYLWGIQIGTGTTAVTKEDYKIETQYQSNVDHAIPSFEFLNPEAQVYELLVHRSFQNNVGTPFDITEVALITEGAGTKRYCIDRTLYNITFGTGESKIITYKFSI